jgi:hypothetical protein
MVKDTCILHAGQLTVHAETPVDLSLDIYNVLKLKGKNCFQFLARALQLPWQQRKT